MSKKSLALRSKFSFLGNGVRVLGTKNEPWVVAADVFKALDGHDKHMSRALKRLDDDEKMVVDLSELGGSSPTNRVGEGKTDITSPIQLVGEVEFVQGSKNTVWIISEPGLYKILLRSRSPKAEAFTRLVTHEVLPMIRKKGYYAPPQPKKERETPRQICKRWREEEEAEIAKHAELYKKYPYTYNYVCSICPNGDFEAAVTLLPDALRYNEDMCVIGTHYRFNQAYVDRLRAAIESA